MARITIDSAVVDKWINEDSLGYTKNPVDQDRQEENDDWDARVAKIQNPKNMPEPEGFERVQTFYGGDLNYAGDRSRQVLAVLSREFMPTSQEIAQAVRYSEVKHWPGYMPEFPLWTQAPDLPPLPSPPSRRQQQLTQD